MSTDCALKLLKEKRKFVNINFDFLRRLYIFGAREKDEREEKKDEEKKEDKD
jgi:hypothetical protein